MNPLHALMALLGQHPAQGQAPQHMAGQALANLAQNMHQAPHASQLQVATPARGYNQQPLQVYRTPVDRSMNTGQPAWHGSPNLGVGTGNQPQLGSFNPGYTALQGSNTQLGQNPQFQGYNAGQGIQARGHMNPQVKDQGFTWNNY